MKREDSEYLQSLSAKVRGNISYAIELIEIFLAQVPDSIKLMNKHISNSSWEDLFFEAHKIKSTIKLLNLDVPLPLIKELELLSQKGEDIEEIHKVYNQYHDAITFEVERLKNIRAFIEAEKNKKVKDL